MQLIRKKVLRFIKEHGVSAPGDTVIVAFSGGADSMALLDILATLPEFPLHLVVAHLNHSLRGEESDGDELFARRAAEKYALPFESAKVAVAAIARERKCSLEEAGRDVRREFLLETAAGYSAAAVALGHHEGDQAETFLLRLLRGAAGSGLTGMVPGKAGSRFIRPLLCLDRSVIIDYLQKGGMEWREDSSNRDTVFLRNRVRHELLPLLESYNPSVAILLNQTARALALDEELLESITEKTFAEISTCSEKQVKVDLTKLKSRQEGLRKRIYRRAIAELKGDLKAITFKHLCGIDALVLAGKSGGRCSLPSGFTAERVYGELVFAAEMKAPAIILSGVAIPAVAAYVLPCGRVMTLESFDRLPDGYAATDCSTLFLDLGRFSFPLSVRYFREGDRFTPFGMSGHKKLKDLFIDRKIPGKARRRIPLLVSGDEILWVCGVQGSEKCRITESSGSFARVQIN